jgi:hypothetical protein
MVIDIRRDYRSDREIKTAQDEKDRMMQEFLDRGGKVEKLKPGIAKGASSLSRSGKLQYTEEEIKAQAGEDDNGSGTTETTGGN